MIREIWFSDKFHYLLNGQIEKFIRLGKRFIGTWQQREEDVSPR